MNKILLISTTLVVVFFIIFLAWINLISPYISIETKSELEEFSLEVNDENIVKNAINSRSKRSKLSEIRKIKVVLTKEIKDKYPYVEATKSGEKEVFTGFDYKLDGKTLTVSVYLSSKYLERFQKSHDIRQNFVVSHYLLLALELLDNESNKSIQTTRLVGYADKLSNNSENLPIILVKNR